MKDFLSQVFLDNSVKSYLIVLGIILLAVVVKRLISKYVAGLLFKLVAKASKNIAKKSFSDLVVQPLDLFLVMFIAFIALDQLNFPSALNIKIYKVTVKDIIECIANGTLIVAFIWLCLRVMDFVAMIMEEKANQTNDLTDNQLIVFFKDFFKVILVLIGVLLVLRFSFHKNIGNLLTGLSIVGAAIALATRESLENLIASFIIFFDKPFIMGDTVKVQNFTGTIEKIGLRSTRIRTEAKTYITVPNKQMVDSILDNVTLRTQRKVELRLDIALSATAAQLQQLTPAIKRILQQHEAIESFSVYLQDTGKNAHVVSVDYFTVMPQEMSDFNELREAVNLAIIALLENSKLELAASNTDVKVYKVN
jgi:MscS family membrane protein